MIQTLTSFTILQYSITPTLQGTYSGSSCISSESIFFVMIPIRFRPIPVLRHLPIHRAQSA